MQTGNYSFDPFPDMPADFGPRIPATGVEGLLVVSFDGVAVLRLAKRRGNVLSYVNDHISLSLPFRAGLLLPGG